MKWTIAYFSESVRQDVANLPSGILASYLRLIEAIEIHGVYLRMPHSRTMGGGLFELRIAHKRLKEIRNA